MADNRCKGIVFTTFVHVLEGAKGKDVLQATLNHPEALEVADVIRHGGIVRGAWYPLDWYRGLHRAGLAITRDAELPRTIGRISTIEDMAGGFFKIVLSVLSPQFVMSASAKVLNRYYERGTMSVSEKAKGRARASLTGCVGFDRNIWLDVAGGCEAALEVAGARDVKLRILSGARDGDEGAEFEALWS